MASGASGLRLFPEMELRNLVPWKRHRPIPIVHELPHWGLIWGALLYLLLLFSLFLAPLPSTGVRVALRDSILARAEKSPWTQSVDVYVTGADGFLVNGEKTTRSALREELSRALEHQAVWVVYVEADANVKFGDVVYAMGTIEDLGATVVWITPGVRAEWEKERRK